MTDAHPLQQLYDREVNFRIETFWDGGFDVKLGDSMNGYKAEATLGTFAEAVAWLTEQATIHFVKRPEQGELSGLDSE